MLLFLIIGVLLGATAVIFALQNVTVITVAFFSWQMQGSLSVILLVAMASGVLVCLLISIPEIIKSYIKFSVLKKQVKKLEGEVATYKQMSGDVSRVSETHVIHASSSTTTE